MNQEEIIKQFESWADENHYALDRSDINKEIYRNILTRNALLGYQAALASKQEHIESNQEPIAWEFIGIAGFVKYVSQRRYELFTDKVKQWYKPFKCSSCNRHKASTRQ